MPDIYENTDGLVDITGTVEEVRFQNEENGYSIIYLETDDGEEIAVVGTMPYISVGERVTVSGNWTVHKSYGRQFKAEYYDKKLPVEDDDILRYLASGAVKGIGPKTASAIVEAFGTDTFDVIENHPEWLTQIKGITEKRAEKIGEDFKAKAGARGIIMFCRDFLPAATAMRLYKKWGGEAVDILKNNPYRLCREINGIGFSRADQIAMTLGLAPDSPERLRAGVLYVLSAAANSGGHTFFPLTDLISETARTLGVGEQSAEEAVERLISEGAVVKYTYGTPEPLAAMTSNYQAERYIADKLPQLDCDCPTISQSDCARFIAEAEAMQGISYAAAQKAAIYGALSSGVFVLTGGPGTGKTTIIRTLLRIFDSIGFDCALAAPTGRAAKRMSEATSREAKTIHRLLEMDYADEENPKFQKNESNRLEADVIIIDEMSMVDAQLMASLLRAVRPGARLVLIGDARQLPSVGAGNVFGDIIDSGVFKAVRLTEVFRQAGESGIVTGAHEINEGRCPNLTQKSSGFFFLPRSSEADIAATVADLYKNRLPRAYGEETVDRIQVISPSRKGRPGTENLNIALQDALNPPSPKKKERPSRGAVFREGDKVMQTKNNYALEWEREDGLKGVGIFNGDIGVIEKIDDENECYIINFDERRVEYDFSFADELEHAYAITVHKSQGSEYPIVIIPVYRCPPGLLTRNLIYTAITRAQEMVVLVGREDVLRAMIDNDRRAERCTALRLMLGEGAR